MPTWGQLLTELNQLNKKAEAQERNRARSKLPPPANPPPSPLDQLRRKYLKRLSEFTGRATIVYASSWQLGPTPPPGADVSVTLSDVVGFMEACSNAKETKLDLILHTPGGDADAAESVMNYLRTQFEDIRVIVPLAAMSAGTMMALASDRIVMGAHSQLGPIDPQLTIVTPEGPRSAPAEAILDQFKRAREECKDPSNIPAWLPIIRGYGPGLLATCTNAREHAEDFAERYLAKYMYADDADKEAKAVKTAKWFADFKEFRSHGRRVGRDDGRAQGLKIDDLEEDDEFQDRVLSVFHAVGHTMGNTPTIKLIENHHGRAWIQSVQVTQQPVLVPGPGGPPPLMPTTPKKG